MSGACRNAGDPGNARLEALKDDPALELTAPGARLDGQSSTEAKTRSFSDTYDGPRVFRSYRLSTPPQQALDFYAAELPGLGWRFVNSQPFMPGSQDVDVVYAKRFGSWEAELMLFVRQQTIRLTLRAPPAVDQRP